MNKAAQVLNALIKGGHNLTETILDLTEKFLDEKDTEGLGLASSALRGHLIDLIRTDSLDELSSLAHAVVIFDLKHSDKMKQTPAGQKLSHQLEYVRDTCSMAGQARDDNFTTRMILITECGKELVETLAKSKNKNGMRPKTLAKKLKISDERLSKILSDFKEEEIVITRHFKNNSFVLALGFRGKAYMKGTKRRDMMLEPFMTSDEKYASRRAIISRKKKGLTKTPS